MDQAADDQKIATEAKRFGADVAMASFISGKHHSESSMMHGVACAADMFGIGANIAKQAFIEGAQYAMEYFRKHERFPAFDREKEEELFNI